MLLPDGATIIPIILSTDKTQLCIVTGDHTAYPCYLTIGNIDKSVRRKPSRHAQVLLAYLPTAKFESKSVSEAKARILRARLFHAAMSLILEPLIEPGTNGFDAVSGDGAVRHGFPIVAVYACDDPEQKLTTCTRQGPKCTVRKDELGDYPATCVLRDQRKTLRTIRHAGRQGVMTRINAVLDDEGLNFVPDPFWAKLPHCNIHTAITPDILHQLFQGLLKNMIEWIQALAGESELDARYSRNPRAHGARHFLNGISGLTNVSGPERKEICKSLIGNIASMPRKVPKYAIGAARALMDLTYYSQYLGQSEESLECIGEALEEFHYYKEVFINTGVRECELPVAAYLL